MMEITKFQLYVVFGTILLVAMTLVKAIGFGINTVVVSLLGV